VREVDLDIPLGQMFALGPNVAGKATTVEILEEVRALAHGVYPAELHDLGLAHALRSLALRSPAPIHVADEGVGLAREAGPEGAASPECAT
jgi:signal transduction histidine kinase